MLQGLERGRRRLEEEVAHLVYYMNGAINLNDAYALSMEQFEILSRTIKTHFEKQEEAIKQSSSKRR
jgi:hypothetical protein